jgi:predicted kinase
VVLTSGLPGSGKDHWVRRHRGDWPVVSLDALRGELGVDPADTQGAVVNRARELARGYLRDGRSFVWNATNVSRSLRDEVIGLFARYGARVHVVYLEVPADVLMTRNRQRPAAVPEAVLERLLDRWEVPDRTEAHRVDWLVTDNPSQE